MHSCNATFVKCEDCPLNTYTATENRMSSCFPCTECSSINNLMTDVKCEANRNTKCKCKPGYYCKHSIKDHCDHCDRVTQCPPGKGVIKNYTHLEDTKCNPCPDGTYSNVTDYISSCKNHTSCESLGRELNILGTPTTDAVCGEFKACRSCNWMLPAGLWAGFVATALIIFLALFIIYWRTKRRSQNSEYFSSTSPTLPPDILKCPASCGVVKHEEDQKLTHIVENYSNMDYSMKCDSGMMQVMTMSEKYTNENDCTDRVICHSIYQSEPQESEWHE